MNNIEQFPFLKWTYIENKTSKNLKKSKGKYLFFSKDRNRLINLAKEILVRYDLSHAKVSLFASSQNFFSLCIYDSEPKLINELRLYDSKKIKYGYWKSNTRTLIDQLKE